MIIEIEQPHGYLLDSDGNVVTRFGNWRLGEYDVADSIRSVEYVDGPAAHSRAVYWVYGSGTAPVSLSVDTDTIINDGADEVTISMTLNPDADTAQDVTLTISGEPFEKTLEPGVETTDTITTTKQAGGIITVEVNGENVQRATSEIEVVSP